MGLISTAVLVIRDFYFFLFTYHHIWLLKKWHESELATHNTPNEETGGTDSITNTGKLPVSLLHAVGDFELFLLYVSTLLADEAPAEIKERGAGRTGHKNR